MVTTRHITTGPRCRGLTAVARACLILALTAVIGVLPGLLRPAPAHATGPVKVLVMGKAPENLPQLRAEAARVEKQIARLDDELEVVVERYNKARGDLDLVTAELAQTRLQLQRAQDELDRQQALIGARLAQMYKMGDYTLVDVLLNSGGFADVQTQVSFFRLIGEQDQRAQAQMQELVSEVRRLEKDLDQRRRKALDLQTQVDQDRAEVEAKLAERQSILDNLDRRIRTILARRARLDAAEAARLARLAGVDLSSIRGTPAQIGAVRFAMSFLGVPYVWGGAGPNGFDCSGLVQYVYARFGVSVPHYAAAQVQMGTPVSLGALEPGDLVFFGTPVPGGVHHVGMYVGKGLFVEAPHTGDVVRISVLAGRLPSAARRFSLTL